MKRVVIWLVNQYQRFISPLFPPSCRYYPTCSNYMLQSVQRFGILKGGIMGIARILRCNPFVRGGYDPVPKKFSLRTNMSWKDDPQENFFYDEEHQCKDRRKMCVKKSKND